MNKEEYIEVISRHKNLIYKICFSFCSDPDDRKDLEQEILVKIWNGFSRFDGRVNISTWIYRIALNTAISFYRSEKKKGYKVSMDSAIFSLSDSSDMETEHKQNVEQLYCFIEELKEFDKALMLLYLDDIKYSEISKIIGITETNVATKINRIKKQLKEKFERQKKE